MHEKNGVITEERFKKMTSVQWMFHYREIMKMKKGEYSYHKIILDRILDRLDVLGVLSNPQLGLKYMDERDKDKEDNKKKEVDKEMKEFMEKVQETTPEKIKVDLSEHYKSKYFLPKYKKEKIKRSLGIKEIKEKVGD